MGRTKKAVQIEPIPKKWLNKEEAKKYLGCSDDLLEKLRNECQVTFARYGGRTYWYELSSIDRFLEKHIIGKAI